MWDQWVIDASFGCQDGMLCFCPLDGPTVVTGMSHLSSRPPEGKRCVGIWHPDGEAEAERFMREHREVIDGLKQSP